jgi:uncharacterized protein YcaQ
MKLELSLSEARPMALAAQGFSNRKSAAKPLAVQGLERLGVLRLDKNALRGVTCR